ncbi:hypothetical protein BD770DRAFT_432311 [Pilaira anomala]|nr:hypothetical protein BD770DRAFT_432311 [Pilaira anomala]
MSCAKFQKRDPDEFKNLIEDKTLVKGHEKDWPRFMAKSHQSHEGMLETMTVTKHAPYFTPSEDELSAMIIQLKEMGAKPDKRRISKADGVIHLAGNEDLEVFVLETAGAFGMNDQAKVSFDNSKGMFALLAMLKTVADKYNHASVEEFSKLKLYLVQPSDRYIRLWSMQYANHGLYNFVREKKILLGKDFVNKSNHVTSLYNFFSTLKGCLKETMSVISVLKDQHDEREESYDSENNGQELLLSDIICPKIFKLSFNTHGQRFANEHLESDN